MPPQPTNSTAKSNRTTALEFSSLGRASQPTLTGLLHERERERDEELDFALAAATMLRAVRFFFGAQG